MIEKKTHIHNREIDIDGPEGNAYVLLGLANQYAKQLDLDNEAIIEEMTVGNYANLVKTFDHYFGQYITIITDNDELIEEIEQL